MKNPTTCQRPKTTKERIEKKLSKSGRRLFQVISHYEHVSNSVKREVGVFLEDLVQAICDEIDRRR